MIFLSSLMPLSRDEQASYKAHFAVYNKVHYPLDVFTRDWQEWEGWNSWRQGRDDFSRARIFSLIRYHHRPNTWLFGGIFEVTERNVNGNTVVLSPLYQNFIGRLLIGHPGPGVPGRAFYLERYFEDLTVAEVLPSRYEGETFPGYDLIDHSFSQMESIFRLNRADWMATLGSIKGVYLITDQKNGKHYVGSAYGDSGIWSRWETYMRTGHGWNQGLSDLIREKGIGYARANFRFSLLEFHSMQTHDEFIIRREQHWKRLLQSIKFGYNRN